MTTYRQGGPEAFAERRAFVLAVLQSLHRDFAALGLLDEAGQHLHRLMALADAARPVTIRPPEG